MQIIGHRGAMGLAPENTLSAIKKALDLKVDMLEFDVHKCKSGELVVIHDNRLERTTNGRGYIHDKNLSELRKFRIKSSFVKATEGKPNEKIPTLSEALDLIDCRAKVNIELKSAGAAVVTGKIINRYIKKGGWKKDDFLVSSYDHPELEKFKKLCPDINVGILYYGIPLDLSTAKKIGAHSVHLCKEFINKKIVNDIRGLNMKLLIYVVNDKIEFEQAKKLGANGVITNFPDLFC